MPKPPLHPTDLRGAARLTTDAVLGLTGLVEALHARIASLPGTPGPAHTGGLTGLVYKTVRGMTRLAGGSAEALLGWLGTALLAPEADAAQAEGHREREAVIAADQGGEPEHLPHWGGEVELRLLGLLHQAGLGGLEGVAGQVRHLPDEVVLRGAGLGGDVADGDLDDVGEGGQRGGRERPDAAAQSSSRAPSCAAARGP